MIPPCVVCRVSRVLSVLSSCGLAGVHLLLSDTRLTLHVAAPADLAVAGQAGEAHGCVVPTSTAQALAAGVFGTGAAARARRVSGGSAEARGVFQVDQVSSAEALAVAARPGQLGLPRGRVGDAQHSHGSVVPVLEQPAGVVERRQLFPTSPYGTRTGNAVALAGGFQAALHRLGEEKKTGRCQSSG